MCVCVSEKVFAYIWAYPHPFAFVCFLSHFKDHLCTPASCALGIDFKIPDDYLSNCIVTILHSQAPSYVTIPCEPQCSHRLTDRDLQLGLTESQGKKVL